METAELYRYLKPLVEVEARRQNVNQSPIIVPSLTELGEKGAAVWVSTLPSEHHR